MDDRIDRMAKSGERMVPGVSLYDPRDLVAHMERYKFAQQYCRGKQVLDAACGSGYGTAMLGDVADHVHGVDRDEVAIRYAWDYYAASNIGYELREVESVAQIGAKFDVAVSFETIEHLSAPHGPRRFLRQIAQVLNAGGILIVSAPEGSTSAWHFWDFTKQDMWGLLEEEFPQANIEYYCQDFGPNIVRDGDFEFDATAPRTHIFVVKLP